MQKHKELSELNDSIADSKLANDKHSSKTHLIWWDSLSVDVKDILIRQYIRRHKSYHTLYNINDDDIYSMYCDSHHTKQD